MEQFTIMGFAGYIVICVQLYCMLVSNVLHLVVTVLHYMFRSTWPSSGVYDFFTFIFLKESASLVFCLFLHVVTLCTFPSMGWVKCIMNSVL
jgi:hypothetical protein